MRPKVLTAYLQEIVNRNLHDVYGYDIQEIAQQAYDLGRKQEVVGASFNG